MYSSHTSKAIYMLCLITLAIASIPTPAAAQSSTRLRLELSGFRTFLDEDWTDNIGYLYTGSVELELPVFPHFALGVRGYPVVYYPEMDVYGAGGGLALRLYSGADNDGLFADVGLAGIWHKSFPGDDSNVDPLLEASIGYKFKTLPIHVALKLDHIAVDSIEDKEHGFSLDYHKLTDKDSGLNALGIGVGLSF